MVPDDLPDESAEELYEDAPCGYLSSRPGGLIVRVNGTFLRWTGYTREELVGRRRFQDLLTGGGRIYHETHYAPLLQMQGEVHEIALEIVGAGGRRLPVLVNSVLVRGEHGRPVLVRTTVFDATERRRYERELLLARDAERDARERTERLQRLTAALAAALNVEQIAAIVVQEVLDGTGAEWAALAVGDEDGGPLRLLAGPGGWDEQAGVPAEARFEEDARTSDGLRAVALLPLRTDGRALGALRYGFAGEHAFPPSERAFAIAVAGQAGQAIERAQLLAERELAAWRAAHLAEVSRALYEVAGYAERVERLVALIRPPVADVAAVEPEDPEAPASDPPAIETPPEGGSRVRLRLRALGRAFGVLTLTRRTPAGPFGRGELPFLADLAGRAALALENARLYEQQRDVARVLQRSLLAWDPPRDGRYDVAATYRPAVRSLEVGGDWHDCFPVGEDRVGIVVGDVVGRGIEAATAMGQLRSATRALAGVHEAPARVIEGLDTFVEQVEAARYATLAYAIIDLETGEMTYACAGHPPPALLEPGGGARLLWDGRSPPVGAAHEDLPRSEARMLLADGARLVLFTDGLVERRFEPLDGGLARLVAELERRGGGVLGALVEEVTDALVLGSSGHDDVCLLAFRYRRGGGRRWPEGVSAGSMSALAPI